MLAAGAGRRLGRPKADVLLGGRRLLDRAVATLLDGGCDEVVAVLRLGQQAGRARPVVNPDPDAGMGSSLRLGVAALGPESDACVLMLVDLPGVGPRRSARWSLPTARAPSWSRPGGPASARIRCWSAGGGTPS